MNATRGWTPPQAFWAYLEAARQRINERAPDADAFASGAKQHDDMTLIVMKVAP